jgi:branched-chain amino acid transport system ATP-binding protein
MTAEQNPGTPTPSATPAPSASLAPSAVPAPAATPESTGATAPKGNGGNGRVVLRLSDVHTYYGHIHALQGISLEVHDGEIVTLLGSNGAGKTTTLKTIHGLLHPRTGTVEFEGADVSRVPAHELVRRGVGQSPEGRRIFSRMTVMENLQMGAYTRRDKGELQADYDRVFQLFPRLQERRNQAAGTLSGGEQQMLAIGRALMPHPTLLLLDEPSMGLAPILVEQIFSIIADINRQGTTILLVEQNALMALRVAARGYVLQTGRIVRAGNADELLEDPEVRKAYLGA